jgi:mRNA-degrading endonuclease RelE of RelBE toxin-antitoxin system
MYKISVEYMPLFRHFYKKSTEKFKKAVNKAIEEIVLDPTLGVEKKGELKGVFVYKFKVDRQEYLLAYEWDEARRLLLAVGPHENFYRDLKR